MAVLSWWTTIQMHFSVSGDDLDAEAPFTQTMKSSLSVTQAVRATNSLYYIPNVTKLCCMKMLQRQAALKNFWGTWAEESCSLKRKFRFIRAWEAFW